MKTLIEIAVIALYLDAALLAAVGLYCHKRIIEQHSSNMLTRRESQFAYGLAVTLAVAAQIATARWIGGVL